MTKELEALERLTEYFEPYEDENNSKPSEAMVCLHKIASKVELADNDDYWEVRNAYAKVEQSLLKAQEQEKVLEIIKEKCLTNCNLALVKDNVHYENYCKEFEYFLNKYNESPNGFEITKEDLLTEEEFDLLKRYFYTKEKSEQDD